MKRTLSISIQSPATTNQNLASDHRRVVANPNVDIVAALFSSFILPFFAGKNHWYNFTNAFHYWLAHILRTSSHTDYCMASLLKQGDNLVKSFWIGRVSLIV